MPLRKPTAIKEIVRYPSGVYYYRKGKAEISLKTTDWDEAVEAYSILVAKSGGPKKASKLKVKDVFKDYLKHRESLLEPAAKEELKKIKERKKKREKERKNKKK